MTGLSEAASKWFIERGIDPETAVSMGIHTGSGGEIVFPFFEGGSAVNHKYRGRGKKFWQDADAVQTWWNADVLSDPTLETLIVTEGEIDALTAIEAGFPHVVSVPNGAPNAETAGGDEDPNSRFHFVYRTWGQLKEVPRFVIATDGDEAGQTLARELVRRFRPHRCLFVTYPDGCKDLNEVLKEYDQAEVVRVLNAAKPYPVKGLYRYSDLPPEPSIKPVSTGWKTLDEYFRPFPGQFIVETGFPGAGKSEWNAALIANLIRFHGWHVTAAVFEESPQRFAAKVKRSYAGRYSGQLTSEEQKDLDDTIDAHLSFISQIPGHDDDDDIDVGYLLDRADAAVIRNNAKMLVIDPWNELDHKRFRDETETDYISRAIRSMKRFAKANEVATLVTAHPAKPDGKHATLYSIAGSAHWANKCDVGLILEREPKETRLSISIRKPRFRECTKHGDVGLNFEWQSGRYFEAEDLGLEAA